ncbi:hypothetical protein AcW1_007387 [Taiwanofungus camphoratus]|nr:hypothetical protein AcW2_007547 [Antrodia cinnamomea]KAI0927343.1 hypothetical protein AcV5_007900 [Antrodia cinnamomea]KAI0953068.1 hypothetical protein AcW1_007387 [Antrodia cinnamomea]
MMITFLAEMYMFRVIILIGTVSTVQQEASLNIHYRPQVSVIGKYHKFNVQEETSTVQQVRLYGILDELFQEERTPSIREVPIRELSTNICYSHKAIAIVS